MLSRPSRLAVAGLVAVALVSCARVPQGSRWSGLREITPAFLAAAPVFEPSLAAEPGGRIALTFVTRDTAGANVWITLSTDSGAHFSAPARVNMRPGKVASYPESRPVATFAPGGRLVVAWASARDTGQMADDIVVRASGDGGTSFGPEVVLNGDAALPGPAYHGFVALGATAGGRVLAAWVDGRAAVLAAGETEPFSAEIWSAASDDGGEHWGPDARVAANACPCCRPSLAASDGGLVVVAYRSVRDSVRDVRLALSRDGGVTFAIDTLVSADGWKLAGCPSTGPALSLGRGGGWVAWLTGAEPHPGVYATTWRVDAGAAGSREPLGADLRECTRPLLADMGSLTLAGVLARAEGGRRVFALRTLGEPGASSPWLQLGANARSAALAAEGAHHALAAWIEQGEAGPRLRLVRVARR